MIENMIKENNKFQAEIDKLKADLKTAAGYLKGTLETIQEMQNLPSDNHKRRIEQFIARIQEGKNE